MGLGEGLAEKVGKGLAKGWRRVGKELAKGWRRVGKGLAQGWRRVRGFPCTLKFRNSRGARLETRVCVTPWTAHCLLIGAVNCLLISFLSDMTSHVEVAWLALAALPLPLDHCFCARPQPIFDGCNTDTGPALSLPDLEAPEVHLGGILPL